MEKPLGGFLEEARKLSQEQFAEKYPYPFLIRARVPVDTPAEDFALADAASAYALLAAELKSETTPVLAKLDKSFAGEVALGSYRGNDIIIESEGIKIRHALFSGELSSRKFYIASKGPDCLALVNFQKVAPHRWVTLANFSLLQFGERDIFLFCFPEGLRELCLAAIGEAPAGGDEQPVGARSISERVSLTDIVKYITVGKVKEAAAMLETQVIDYGHRLISVMERDQKTLKNLLKVFELIKDYNKAAIVSEKLGLTRETRVFQEKARDFSLGIDLHEEEIAKKPVPLDLEDYVPQQRERPEHLSIEFASLEAIKDNPVLAGLNPLERETLSRIVRLEQYDRNKVVSTQDAVGKGLYLIKSGALAKVRLSAEKNEVLAKLVPGNYAGEKALLNQAAPFSLFSVAETEVVLIPNEGFQQLQKTSPELTAKILFALLADIHKADPYR